mgnify:CR=1 FL=1
MQPSRATIVRDNACFRPADQCDGLTANDETNLDDFTVCQHGYRPINPSTTGIGSDNACLRPSSHCDGQTATQDTNLNTFY